MMNGVPTNTVQQLISVDDTIKVTDVNNDTTSLVIDNVKNALKAKQDINEKDITTTYAKIDSPAFTGIPLAPTPSSTINSEQIATTAYVKELINELIDSSPETLNTLKKIAVALSDKQQLNDILTALSTITVAADEIIYSTDTNKFSTTPITQFSRTLLASNDASAARTTLSASSIDSPVFTGTPTAPTAATETNNTQIATTAFVKANIPTKVSVSDTALNIPTSDVGGNIWIS